MINKNIILSFGLAVGALYASGAHAHAKVDVAEPNANSELVQPPKEIRLQFSDTLEPAFTKIQLLDAKNVVIKLPKAVVDRADPKIMSAQLPVLRSGQYLVRWSTMTRDSHKVKGEYRFKVK